MRDHPVRLPDGAFAALGRKEDREQQAPEPRKTKADVGKGPFQRGARQVGKDGEGQRQGDILRHAREAEIRIPDQVPDGQAGTLMKTESKFLMRFDDVECEVLFRGLDDANDVRRLLSLQLTFGMMDEFREINPDIYNALTGRLGRYPDKTMNGVGACDDTGKQIHKVWGATNPPDADTFWEEQLNDPPGNMHVTIQPSGLSPEADWVQFLPEGYYDNLCEGKSEDWIDVYVHGKFGRSLSGMPVYQRTFAPEFHIASSELSPVQNADYPITIGIDFGRTPAAAFMQRDPRGRVLVLSEITSENMGLETFIQTRLNPHIANHYPGYKFVAAPDPAGFMKQQANEMTLVDQLKQAGFHCVKPPTNDPDKRIQAVERLLNQQIEGKAMFLIDPRCTQIIKGFRSGYRYKVKKNGEMEDKPDKNDSSHVHDALQYGAAVIDMNIRGFGLNGSKRREVKPAPYRYT